MRINLCEIAKTAVDIEFSSFPALVGTDALWDMPDGTPQEAFHVVIDRLYLDGSAELIYERSYKDGGNGEYDFLVIAHSKCAVSVRTGKDTRDVPPEDRLPGETEYWGSVVGMVDVAKFSKEELRLVIAGSGYKSEYDEAICDHIGMTMSALIEIRVRTAHEAGDDSPVEFVIEPLAA